MADTAEETSDKKSKKERKEEFEERQAALRDSQNVPEGGVPEQRPQASTVSDDPPHSELTQKLMDAGDPNVPDQGGPMDLEAYEKADSDDQKKAAAKASRPEGIHVGNLLKVVGPEDNPHVGRYVAVTRIVEDRSDADSLARATGSPAANLIVPQVVEGTAIRDERDGEHLILDLDEVEVEKVRDGLGALARR